eukprot:Hpha_TRINITY_DN5259_c0_g1::TRINITY_DN5259_c0_g1_i1::g.116559::m.116559
MLGLIGLCAVGAGSYGSSNFGEWLWDDFGLPGFRYKGHPNASTLPEGHAPKGPVGAHGVGNDRVVGLVYTDGSFSLRYDEGGAKLLHAASANDSQYRGGVGYLAELGSTGAAEGIVAASVASNTLSPGVTPDFSLVFGVGYTTKTVKNTARNVSVQHALVVPFGDDGVVLSSVTITDTRGDGSPAGLRTFLWTEIWSQLRTDWRLSQPDDS